MAPAMVITSETKTISKKKEENNDDYDRGEYYLKGVKHLCDNGITKLPSKYILPPSDRPAATINNNNIGGEYSYSADDVSSLKLPVIDFAELHGPNRSQLLKSLAYACENFGFFQLVNHGITSEVINNMMEVGRSFFELPFEERQKYMSTDMRAPVRYGTSFNQTKDGVFCWRDFLKLVSHPLSDSLPHWPSSPLDFRQKAVTYANESKILFAMIVEAILESLILTTTVENKPKNIDDDDDDYVVEEEILKEFEDGSHLMVVNCYPPCPEPELTLGMPPHSDYGFLTLVLQDEVQGLQIQSQNKWVTIEPVPNSFVVNVGDHLEIFSNGKYKSVLHRVLANSKKPRISIASLHSLPFESIVRPWTKLVNETSPRQYMDTYFSDFLNYLVCNDSKKKIFLESRKLT